MNAEKIIYDSFLKSFEQKNIGNVGCELEFPLVNTKKSVKSLFDMKKII